MRVTSRLFAAAATVALPLAALGAAPTVASASATTAATAPKIRVVDCQGTPAQFKPRVMFIACGDGGLGVSQLRWTDWGTRRAHATGELFVNDCTPNCAEGHFHYRRADVLLSRLSGHRYHFLTVMSPNHPHTYRTIRQSLPG